MVTFAGSSGRGFFPTSSRTAGQGCGLWRDAFSLKQGNLQRKTCDLIALVRFESLKKGRALPMPPQISLRHRTGNFSIKTRSRNCPTRNPIPYFSAHILTNRIPVPTSQSSIEAEAPAPTGAKQQFSGQPLATAMLRIGGTLVVAPALHAFVPPCPPGKTGYSDDKISYDAGSTCPSQ